MAEAGCLMWLTDLTLTNVHHVKLSRKVHLKWDEAESKNEPFTIQIVYKKHSSIGQKYVRQNSLWVQS